MGKRPEGWLWAAQRPTITSLNKTARKESPYPTANSLIVKLRSKQWAQLGISTVKLEQMPQTKNIVL